MIITKEGGRKKMRNMKNVIFALLLLCMVICSDEPKTAVNTNGKEGTELIGIETEWEG